MRGIELGHFLTSTNMYTTIHAKEGGYIVQIPSFDGTSSQNNLSWTLMSNKKVLELWAFNTCD